MNAFIASKLNFSTSIAMSFRSLARNGDGSGESALTVRLRQGSRGSLAGLRLDPPREIHATVSSCAAWIAAGPAGTGDSKASSCLRG